LLAQEIRRKREDAMSQAHESPSVQIDEPEGDGVAKPEAARVAEREVFNFGQTMFTAGVESERARTVKILTLAGPEHAWFAVNLILGGLTDKQAEEAIAIIQRQGLSIDAPATPPSLH
jgi:hypothetical protein